MARKPKLSKEITEEICKGIRMGLTYARSAQLAGISEATFYNWKKRGEEAKSGQFLEFLEALKKAEIEGEARLLENIHFAGQSGNWQASAWILERRYPEKYGRRTAHDVRALVGVGVFSTPQIIEALKEAEYELIEANIEEAG